MAAFATSLSLDWVEEVAVLGLLGAMTCCHSEERAFMAREDELAKEERARDRIKSLGMEAFPDLFQKVSQPLK